MGPDAMILVFWMLSFKSAFSLSSFTFIKRLFSSYSLSAIRVVSSAYLRLLIFLPVILIPACASSSRAFLMMSSAYKLNKQGVNIQPWHTPSPILNHSAVPCPVLTVASWPAYRFLRRQVRWSGIPSFSGCSSLLWSTVTGFGVVSKGEVGVFLEFPCFLYGEVAARTCICRIAACAKSLQSCPTLCDSMHCGPPGSSVHGTLQARILGWVTMPSSRRSSPPNNRTWSPESPALQADSLPLAPPRKPPALPLGV